MTNIKLEFGVSFGLFAVFSILRYRTEDIPIKEMVYLFIIIAIALINALSSKKVSLAETAFANIIIVGMIYLLENLWLMRKESSKIITYEKIENILPEEIQEELRLSLEKQPRNYLFVNSSLAPYDSRTAFSVWACRALTRCLKHPMTLTVLRHLYIGYQASCKSTKELRLIARKMGHSRNMQRMYEWDKSQEWITDE